MNKFTNEQGFTAVLLTATLTTALAAQTAPEAAADRFDGYDFGQVVETMESSVNPLQREMVRSFKVFVQSVREAEALLDTGDTQKAVQTAASASATVLAVR